MFNRLTISKNHNLKFVVSFVLILCSLYIYLNFPEILFKRPESVHMWAMCDRASVARNYAEESMNFFLPRINETREKEGITGLEFPLMNYGAAIFYKVFGFNEFWYRFLMLLTISLGLVAAFVMSLAITKKYFAALCITLACYLSPVIVYYSPGFIADIASLGFILIAWCFLFRYTEHEKTSAINGFLIFGALASLIKITSLISIVVVLVICMLDYKKLLSQQRTSLIRNKGKILWRILTIFILVASWYKYASWLSINQNNGVFLMQANTPSSLNEYKMVWQEINKMWVPFYFPEIVYWITLFTAISLIIFFRKVNRLFGFITAGLWIGNIIFVLIMFNQFRQHDYYIITLIPALIFQFISFADLVITHFHNIYIRNILVAFSLIVICYQASFAKKQLGFRYDKNSWIYYGNQMKYYFTIEPYLKSLGIKRTDKVVHIGDESPNIALYFMNVKGWSDKIGSSDEEIIGHIHEGAKYLITGDSAQASRPGLQPYIDSLSGKYGNVVIYRLKK